MHKTYLVLGSFPKFHIESFGEAFFGGTRTFGILMLNVLRGTFIFSWCFLALEPCLRRDCFFPFLFPNPQWSHLNVWVLLLDNTQVQVKTRIPSLIFVVWWTGLGSPQQYWANYEPSCTQNMDPTIHTHLYIENIYILHSREQ